MSARLGQSRPERTDARPPASAGDGLPADDGPSADVHHVLLGAPSHGVTRLARQLTEGRRRTGLPAPTSPAHAEVLRDRLPPVRATPAVHLHLTDGLLGADPAATLAALVRGRRAAITLHDVPQPGEGEDRRRRRAGVYRGLADAADLVVVSSEHERDGLAAMGVTVDHVLPLPIDARRVRASPALDRTVGVLGWIHPGKGHADVAAALAALDGRATLVALGGVARGHEGLDDELAATCARLGVGFRCAGYLDEVSLLREAARVAVPVCPHRHVSASGSMGSWLSAGRRPVVVDGAYAREVAARSPGALRLTHDLAGSLAAALDDPASTVLPAGVPVGPTTAEAAAAQDALLVRWARRAPVAA